MKGPDVREEMEEAGKALHTLGKTTLDVKQFRLPEEMGTRSSPADEKAGSYAQGFAESRDTGQTTIGLTKLVLYKK